MSDQLGRVRACAADRVAAQAAFEGALRAAVKAHTLAEVAVAAGLSRGRVSQIVGPVGRAAGRPAKDAGEAAMRARLAKLDAKWDAVVSQVQPMFMPANPRGEQARRNVNNGKARRQLAGVTRNGRRSGSSGAKRQLLPTVAVEARVAAEKYLLEQIQDHLDDPGVARVCALLEEGEALRAELAARRDARVGF